MLCYELFTTDLFSVFCLDVRPVKLNERRLPEDLRVPTNDTSFRGLERISSLTGQDDSSVHPPQIRKELSFVTHSVNGSFKYENESIPYLFLPTRRTSEVTESRETV